MRGRLRNRWEWLGLDGLRSGAWSPLLSPPTPQTSGTPNGTWGSRCCPRPRLRTILTALFYLVRAGGAWRLLPHEFPPCKPVSDSFRHWRLDGTWERLHTALREQLRVGLGRDPPPSAGIIARPVGQDDQRRRRARLRRRPAGPGALAPLDLLVDPEGPLLVDPEGPLLVDPEGPLLVDPEGLVLAGAVHPAEIRDRDGGKLVLADPDPDPVPHRFPRLRHVWLDAGYNGRGKGTDWIEATRGWRAEIGTHRPRYTKVWVPKNIPPDQLDWSTYLPPPGLRVLPRRWVVEGTFRLAGGRPAA